MKQLTIFLSTICLALATIAQQKKPLSIEQLWKLNRINPIRVDPKEKLLFYSVSTPDVQENKSRSKKWFMPLSGGEPVAYVEDKPFYENLDNARVSPDRKYVAFTKEVPLEPVIAKDKYKDLPKSDAYIYTTLNQRHWDTWEDGRYSHIFIGEIGNGELNNVRDIMPNEKYDCPQKPFGGTEDLIWSPDSKSLIYVCKKKYGTEYALSTNTDLYEYKVETGITENITQGMMGYDQNPSFSPDGKYLAWLSMARDGFESDKQDVKVMDWNTRTHRNITANYDETIESFIWSNDANSIYMVIPHRGTKQLFSVNIAIPTMDGRVKKNKTVTNSVIRKITQGPWDINDLVGEVDGKIIATRSDINHANEIYSIDINTGQMNAITNVNKDNYSNIAECKVRERYTEASDGKKLFSWIVYPPNFDSTKKYPVLLYCQGGPQGSISQFYSYRWNFALMASQGYIVVVPNRRGCQGWGVEWNEAISKDWGGQAISDYLRAFDDVVKEKYVDKNRCAAVGASYGGYSVFMLAGMNNNRFKSFIAHDGLFDLTSWYGTTDELWFANWDIGGKYWDDKSTLSYVAYNPSNFVIEWNTPILIIQGGKDYRVGIEQGLQAFQVAQLKGIKSKLLYFPEENHWVLKPQNAQVWQREFFDWLSETLK